MNSVRNYLIAVVSVCMISVLAVSMVQHASMKKIIRFVSGILILLVAVSPLLTLDFERLTERLEEYTAHRDFDSGKIEEAMHQQLSQHIKQTTETYIEDKAAELGAAVQAEVSLSEDEYPVPIGVTIIGTLLPEQRATLADYLTGSLNIPVAQQEWKLYGTSE